MVINAGLLHRTYALKFITINWGSTDDSPATVCVLVCSPRTAAQFGDEGVLCRWQNWCPNLRIGLTLTVEWKVAGSHACCVQFMIWAAPSREAFNAVHWTGGISYQATLYVVRYNISYTLGISGWLVLCSSMKLLRLGRFVKKGAV